MYQYIKKFFGLNSLYDRKYGLAYVTDTLYIALAIFFISIYSEFISLEISGFSITKLVIYLMVVLAALYYVQEIIQALAISWRMRSRGYQTLEDTDIANSFSAMAATAIDTSSIKEELGTTPHVGMLSPYENNKVYDVRYDFYHKTKYGDYKAKEVYYTVFEYKLQRELPNIVFDAKRAKGRQFGKLFVGAQKITLEGNFSDVFDVYMPMYYQVDSLSFITPEVMQEMLALGAYDFEIKGDKFMCYAPLLAIADINKLVPQIDKLYLTLNDNLEAYRDERLAYAKGRKHVTQFASKLLASPKKYIPATALCGAGILAILYFGLIYDDQWFVSNIALVLYASFGFNIYKIIIILAKNKKIEQEFINSQ